MRPSIRPLALLAVLALSVAACSVGTPPPTPTGVVTGTLTAGPACPVESDPPDPACAPRPVAGADVAALDEAGREIARTSSGVDGRYALTLPYGRFVIRAEPAEGYFGVSDPVPVEMDAREYARVADFRYETGIR